MRPHCTLSDCSNILKARGLCSTHYRRWQRHGDPLFVTPPPTGCPHGHPYAGENLYVNKRGSNVCRECTREAGREWQKKYPERAKASQRRWKENNLEAYRLMHNKNKIKRRYGITLEEREAMREAQGGLCAICRRTNGNGGLVVDHDHTTGIVRGLLCHNCNLSLGKYEDNSAWLREAIKYLERPRTVNGAQYSLPTAVRS